MHGQSHITDTHGKKHFKGYNYIHMFANWALRGPVPNYKRVGRKKKKKYVQNEYEIKWAMLAV